MERDTMKKILLVLFVLILTACGKSQPAQLIEICDITPTPVTEEVIDEPKAPEPINRNPNNYGIEWVDEKTARIQIDGGTWTFFPFEFGRAELNLSKEFIKSHGFTFLSDMQNNSVPWTFVTEGDTFLGWNIKSVDAVYIFIIDFREFDPPPRAVSYPYPIGNAKIQFEGEVTIRATINFSETTSRIHVAPHYEYLHLFPAIFDTAPYENNTSLFVLRNETDALEARLGFGRYEAELTISDYWIDRLPHSERYNSAELVSIEILSFIDRIDDEAKPPLPEYVPGSVILFSPTCTYDGSFLDRDYRRSWEMRGTSSEKWGVSREQEQHFRRHVLDRHSDTTPWVQFIQHFDIPKWLFIEVEEQNRNIPFIDGRYDEHDEPLNADIIYTFDNDIINTFYRYDWEEYLEALGGRDDVYEDWLEALFPIHR
jgi:hypothetical protein